MDKSRVGTNGKVRVECRAVASDGEVQNARIEDMYNVRGIMNNAFDVTEFTVEQ